MAQQRPHQADIRIDVESYPSLKLLCWILTAARITRRDAFAIEEADGFVLIRPVLGKRALI